MTTKVVAMQVFHAERGVWRVSSRTERGRWWPVKCSKSGAWSCACGRWLWQKVAAAKRVACHHIETAQAWMWEHHDGQMQAEPAAPRPTLRPKRVIVTDRRKAQAKATRLEGRVKRLLAKRAAQVERHAAQMQALEEKIEQVRARLGRVAKKVA